MPTANAVLQIAKGELGTHENPIGSNRQKYGKWYGMDGYPWCAMFTSWVLNRASITKWRHAYTPTGMQMFKDAGMFRPANTDAKPGWLVYFNFDSDVGPEHVGFVVKDNGDGTINTIEGNTSASASGSQANGDGVYAKQRNKSLVLGYGVIDYSKPEPPEAKFAVTAVKIVEKVVKEHAVERTVKELRERGFIVKKERIKEEV